MPSIASTPPAPVQNPAKPLSPSLIPTNPPDLSDKLPKLSLRKGPNPPSKKAQSQQPPVLTPNLAPPPTAISSIPFTTPHRRIYTTHDHALFIRSQTYTTIVAFAFTLTDSVRDVTCADITSQKAPPYHPTIKSVLEILQSATDLLTDFPPDASDHNSRFGNPLYRSYINALSFKVSDWHATHFPSVSSAARDELTTYFLASLGSPQRLDYGSGHELHFLIYLLALYRLSLLPRSAFPAAALAVFPAYLTLVRKCQTDYYLEPAGSHGVWGLDDFHFLPFLLGSAQLANHPFIRPLAIHSTATVQEYADEFLYLDMVRAAEAGKTVRGLRWHSPMLDDISGVRGGWARVEQGLRRMFEGEVVGKTVVVQHLLFGGLVPAVDGMSERRYHSSRGDEGVEEGEEGCGVGSGCAHEHKHVHNSDAWGDCCGIRVPSGAGALGEMKKRMGEELRTIPLD